jgi:hypothetical protein
LWWRGTDPEWAAFRTALAAGLEDRGDQVPAPGRTTVAIRQLDGCTFDADLSRLADDIRGRPLADWQTTLTAHFADMHADAEAVRVELFGLGLEHVRPLLRPRLLLQESLPAWNAPLHRAVGAGLVAALEVSGEHTEHRVTVHDVAAWGADVDGLWAAAYANLRSEHHVIEQQGSMSTVTGSSSYVASHVLRLGELLDDAAPNGVLFAVPHPYLVLFHRLAGADSVLVLRDLPRTVATLADDRFGVFSMRLYWWQDGVVEEVTVGDTGQEVGIGGSERFTAAFDRLLQEAAQGPRP